ncbi:hypothetical protein PDESU_04930 [Pontiella desulfatans]|uniref:Uncharacterized protein n=1 Tax=Pontiella desulfatans TaxID=2750659 RepID=A0A6C2U8X9_PONDE|nr:glycoside hydrolase family protein [Pontiella desulfatans]VGO16339.1 hypothetical protein PDESU_04930 [Pontiella desulfatans]
MKIMRKTAVLFLSALVLMASSIAAKPEAGARLKFSPLPFEVKSTFAERKTTAHVFADPGYRIWGMAVIQWADGKYHGYYARWPEALGHDGWMTHCEIAHAVADQSEGPFQYVNTVLESRNPDGWDVNNAHNPAICVVDGKICLYYIANDLRPLYKGDFKTDYPDMEWFQANRKLVRNAQRIGVAIASDPAGPFVRSKEPVVVPHGRFINIAVNPAVCYVDGTYTMIMKGDDANKPDTWFRIQLVGHSQFPEGPFTFQQQPVYSKKQTEDAGIWFDQKAGRYYMACHVMGKRDLALFSSNDGKLWQPDRQRVFMKKQFRLADGSVWKPDRVERPFILTDDSGKPVMLYLAVADKDINGNIAVKFNN